jgi:branched-chain amino acid transport system ATP-binding protein
MLLEVKNIHIYYGTFQAIRGISLSIDVGEVATILGANGAGKTTLLKTISGLLRPKTGSIQYRGNRLEKLSTDKIVRLGISQAPEGRMLFPEMQVSKNLDMGAFVRRKNRKQVAESLQEVYDLFPVLEERNNQTAGTLSGGEQTMLTIGRALMSNPRLLMLDEPSLGLAPIMVSTVMEGIVRIKQQGRAILLVEQNAAESLRIADHGYVLETGRVVISDTSENLVHNEKIKEAYLGA